MNAVQGAASVRTLCNPAWLEPARYVSFLNKVFPGQWDRRSYDWYAGRSFGGRSSDILVRADDTRILAGMALCFRQVIAGSGEPIDVCVISAAATLPSERSQGHYALLLEAAREHCRSVGYVALFGFVTRDNNSRKGLLRLGAHEIPSFYVTSVKPCWQGPRKVSPIKSRALPPRRRSSTVPAPPRLGAASNASAGQGARFWYPSAEDWQQQFLRRPNPVRAMTLAHDSIALVETVRSTDRLQWLACPRGKLNASIARLSTLSAGAGRAFFMYTLDPLQAAAAQRAGLKILPGYLMMLPTGLHSAAWQALTQATWQVQSGDRV
jgi:GNAT superfamily N-acetyltransferase